MFRQPENPVLTPRFDALLEHIPADWKFHEYLLCGSACLAVRRIRDVADLDIFVHPDRWAEAVAHFLPFRDEEKHAAGGVYDGLNEVEVGTEGGERILICTTLGVDVFSRMPRVASSIDFDAAHQAGTTHFLSNRPHRVIAMRQALAIKALADRVKDLDDMATLAQRIRAEEGH